MTRFALAFITALAAAALLFPADLAPATRAPTFALEGAEGVGFDGAFLLNEYLSDTPRPASVRVSGGAEPSILVDKDRQYIWIGDTNGLSRSADGGATWQRMPDPFLPSVVTDGWALAQDDAGRLFVATTIGPTSPVAMSTTDGASWDFTSHVNGVATVSDRPWLAARGDGEVSLVVNAGIRGEECYRSTDAGLTWTSFSTANTGTTIAGNLVYDSQGSLWFHDGSNLQRWRKPCATAPNIIDTVVSGPTLFVQVDVDEADRLYDAHPSRDSTQMIVKGYSVPSKSLVVSDPSLRSNTFPTISVLDSGELAVAWYGSETAGDPSVDSYAGSWNVYVARVKDFWSADPTITTTRLTSAPNHVGDFCMGGIGCSTGSGDRDLLDYFMIDLAPDGVIHVAYGHDGAGSASEVRYARVEP